MNVNIHNRTLALAGLFQAARLVQQTARGEPRDKDATTASIGSIFNTDPASVVDVYGDIAAVRTGLELLVQHIECVEGVAKLGICCSAVFNGVFGKVGLSESDLLDCRPLPLGESSSVGMGLVTEIDHVDGIWRRSRRRP